MGGKILLLGRDGVLNRERAGGVLTANHLVIIPQALQALRLLEEAEWTTLVITAGGAELRADLDPLLARAALDHGGRIAGFYAGGEPVTSAREAWDFDPAVTWMVCAVPSDLETARAEGCMPVLVQSDGREGALIKDYARVPVFDDLLALTRSLLDND